MRKLVKKALEGQRLPRRRAGQLPAGLSSADRQAAPADRVLRCGDPHRRTLLRRGATPATGGGPPPELHPLGIRPGPRAGEAGLRVRDRRGLPRRRLPGRGVESSALPDGPPAGTHRSSARLSPRCSLARKSMTRSAACNSGSKGPRSCSRSMSRWRPPADIWAVDSPGCLPGLGRDRHAGISRVERGKTTRRGADGRIAYKPRSPSDFSTSSSQTK